jgi:branched-chain amino acid transport system ATP-binding protein
VSATQQIEAETIATQDEDDTPILRIANVELRFGGVKALSDVSFEVGRAEIVALVGPNGAGKSSMLNCLSGLYVPQRGSIELEGRDIVGDSPGHIARAGMGRTFQNAHLYLGLSVLDNVLAGMTLHDSWMLTSAIIRPWGLRREARARRKAEEIIEFVGLEAYRDQPTDRLGYGIRKRVDLARALATEPSVLLMDEPMAGMNQDEKADMARFVLDIHGDMGLPIVLVEHDMAVITDICDRAVVLNWGQMLAEGPPTEVLRRDDVVAAYIGTVADAEDES